MKSASLAILIVFVTLSLFGFVGMLQSSDMGHAPNTCFASLAQNGACPPPEHTLASAFFHTNALKVFGTALLSFAFAIGLFSVTLPFAGFVRQFLQFILSVAQTLTQRMSELISQYLALQSIRLALIRLEHSPTSL